MRLPTINLSWHRFVALILLVSGLWLESVFAALLIPGALGNPHYKSQPDSDLENVAIGIFVASGAVLIVLSYFVARQRNWARVVIVLCLVGSAFAIVAVLVNRICEGKFRTADEIGEFVVGTGFLLLPFILTMFLINKPVADDFNPGKVQHSSDDAA